MTRDRGTEIEGAAFEAYLRRPSRRRLSRVVDLFYGHVWSVAQWVAGNGEDAADICQDVFLSLLLRPPAPGAVRSPRGWLTSRIITIYRQRRTSAERRARREARRAALFAEENGISPDDREDLRDAIEKLPERIRTVIDHRYLGGLQTTEIAEALGLSVRSVENDLQRGRRLLKRRLGETVFGALAILGASEWSALGPPPPGLRADILRIVRMGRALEPSGAAGASTAGPSGLSVVLGGMIMSAKGIAVGGGIAAAILLGLFFFPRGRPPESGRGPGHLASGPSLGALPRDESRTPRKEGKDDPLPPPVDLQAADRDRDLFGIVLDEDGMPIPGARIETVYFPWRLGSLLLDRPLYDEEKAGPMTRSATDGSFLLQLHRGDMVDLLVSARGHARKVLGSRMAGERVTVVLGEASALEVLVRDEAGKPVPDVRLDYVRLDETLRSDERTRRYMSAVIDRRRGATDRDGRFVFDEAEPGMGSLQFRHDVLWGPGSLIPGMQDVEIPRGGIGRIEVTMTLAGRTIEGQVVDAETGEPIEGARVGAHWVLERPVTTGADGRYRYPGWTGIGASELHVIAEGYGREMAKVPPEGDVDFELFRGDEAAGRVIRTGGQPIEGAMVTVIASLHSADRMQQEIDTRTTATGANGRFALTSLRRDLPHTLVIAARARGRCLYDFDSGLAAEGRIDFGDLVLPEARSIEGALLDGEGRPLPDTTVSCRGSNGDRGAFIEGWKEPVQDSYGDLHDRRTDDLGRFRFPELAPGEYTLSARLPSMAEIRTTVTLPPDQDVFDVELRPLPGKITVVVRDEAGNPIPDVEVSVLAPPRGSMMAKAKTDRDGRAPVSGLPEGEAWIRLGDVKGFLDTKGQKAVPAGQEILFVLERPALVYGQVVGPDGEALASMEVIATWETESQAEDSEGNIIKIRGWRTHTVITDERGAFEVPTKQGTTVDLEMTGIWLHQDGEEKDLRRELTPLRGKRLGIVAPAEGITIRANNEEGAEK